jgi:hypothetical protein
MKTKMELGTLILIFVLVFITGFLFAPLGLGGGLLFVPIFHYIAGWPIESPLMITSLLLTAVVSFGSGTTHIKAGHWDKSVRNTALFGAIPGALAGVGLFLVMGSNMGVIFKSISVVMIGWAILKTWQKLSDEPNNNPTNDGEKVVETIPLRIGASIGGGLSAVLGIGAGAIYIPILRQYANVPARKAIGTSLSIMMIVVPIALLAHSSALTGEHFDFLISEGGYYLLPSVAIFAISGASIGAKVGLKYLPSKVVVTIFFAILWLIWIRYVVDLSKYI